ncbi:MAG: class I SAM-dependent methyltransferase [Sulfolobales archaeon]
MRDIELNEVRDCITWYNALSSSYDELYGEEQRIKYKKILKHLRKDLGAVLDVGCGTATLLEYLMDSGYRVLRYTCIDVSDKIIEIASKKFISNRYGTVLTDFIVADLTFPPFRVGNLFDLITMITVLRENYNVSNIINNYLDKVKEEGYLVYTVIRKGLRSDELRYEEFFIVNNSGKSLETQCISN